SAPPPAATVQVESEPAGAEAKASVGPSCRTPCALSIASTNPFTVTFTLAGYESLTVPVAPRPAGDPRDSSEGVKFEPDPVYAQPGAAAPGQGQGAGRQAKSPCPARRAEVKACRGLVDTLKGPP